LSSSASPAVGPCGIPPADVDDVGAGVEVVCVVGAGVEVVCVEVAACVGAAVGDVTGGVGAALEVAGGVAAGAEAGAEEPAVLLCLALVCLTLLVLVVCLGLAAGSAALVAVEVVAVDLVAGAEALVAVEELDPQPATARQARASPQRARRLIDPVMAVTMSVFQFCRGGERSV
jgi:hypothetical protein